MNTNELYELLDIDRQLVMSFSIFFSRFEYALKRTIRYAKGDKNGVNPNWDKFATDHDLAFIPDRLPNLKTAVDYLQAKPPRKQIVKNGTLGWNDVQLQNIPRLQQILCAVRRVRNNLFHGGKFPDGPIEEPGRDKKLLQSCMTILEECLTLNEEVRTYFSSNRV